jgi:hypothetical protein
MNSTICIRIAYISKLVIAVKVGIAHSTLSII